MSRLEASVKIVALMALTTLLFTNVTSAQTSQNETEVTQPSIKEPVPASPDEALVRDAQWYAENFGVSLEEATRRLSMQNAIGDLNGQLTASERETFGGLWIENEPGYAVKARFTQGGEETLQRYTAGTSLQGLVEALPASSTEEQLVAAETEARFVVDTLGVPAESGVDLPDNRAYISVLDREKLNVALEAANVSLPREVEVREVEEFLVPQDNIYAGLRLYRRTGAFECTSGFSMVRANGDTGTSTAGHCASGLDFQSQPIIYQSQNSAFVGPYDVQFHLTPGFVDRPWSKDAQGYRVITAARGRLDSDVGDTACHYGQGGAAPEYKCGTIADRYYRPIGPGYNNPTATFVLVDNLNVDLSDQGDSGGPWQFGDTALGIHSGGGSSDPSHKAFYMSVTYLDNDGPQDLNLSVRKGN